MRAWTLLARVVVALVTFAALTAGGVPLPSAPPSPEVHLLAVPGSDAALAYCATRPVDRLPPHVTRVVVAVHGLGGDACTWRGAVADALRSERSDTEVIAPQFGPAARPEVLGWSPQAWPAGEAATGGGPSSYAALDALVATLAGRQVMVAGFSGGGQLVNRYAAMSPAAVSRYVVMNPSSYVYFTPERPGAPTAALAACPRYNDWRYGLDNRPPYAARLTVPDLAARYAARHVTYLIGSSDDSMTTPSLDRSCGALLQGPERKTRAHRYHEHLVATFGPGITQRQRLFTVAGVGHDGPAMVQSEVARAALLGR